MSCLNTFSFKACPLSPFSLSLIIFFCFFIFLLLLPFLVREFRKRWTRARPATHLEGGTTASFSLSPSFRLVKGRTAGRRAGGWVVAAFAHSKRKNEGKLPRLQQTPLERKCSFFLSYQRQESSSSSGLVVLASSPTCLFCMMDISPFVGVDSHSDSSGI